MAHVTRKSILTDVVRTLYIPQYAQIDFELRYNKWKNGNCLITEAFPLLTPEQLYFIEFGFTKDEDEKFL